MINSRNKIYSLLFEEEERLPDAPENPVRLSKSGDVVKARKSTDSVDNQIDSLILMYEQKAIREKDVINESLTSMSLKMLFEQEEELEDLPEEEEELPEEEEEMDTAEPEGSEKMDVKEPAKEDEIPDIDIDEFTIKIARLVMNHNNLLRVEDAIINRTKKFLDENYGDRFVAKYLQILDEQFGLKVDEFSNIDYPEEDNFAVGANPAGAGMTGGA